MKPRPPLPEGPFLVVGLARSGAAVAGMLAERGETVRGVDSSGTDQARRLASSGVEVLLDVPPSDQAAHLNGMKTVVKSPGVPQDAPAVAAARERGIPVVGELELAWRALPNRFCAVTGTNGKTTTVELLGHIFRTAGEPMAVAGNVGTPLASLAGETPDDATIVCECSSFQLEDASEFAPECAVLLNVTPDHLDRHGDFDSYRDAKLRIFANQDSGDVAVFPDDDPGLADRIGGRAKRAPFSAGSTDGELSLPGEHNAANAAAAETAALALGLDREAVRDGLKTFAGIPHRLERVAERNGVLFVNDSKATNVAAASAGLRAFDRPVLAILGGSLKGESFEALALPVADSCRAVYLIGEAAPQLEGDLGAIAGVEIERRADLRDAVETAAAAARPGDVVLLSPACASFDAYEDFEERGNDFKRIVGELT